MEMNNMAFRYIDPLTPDFIYFVKIYKICYVSYDNRYVEFTKLFVYI